jgi:hypothetical protein
MAPNNLQQQRLNTEHFNNIQEPGFFLDLLREPQDNKVDFGSTQPQAQGPSRSDAAFLFQIPRLAARVALW